MNNKEKLTSPLKTKKELTSYDFSTINKNSIKTQGFNYCVFLYIVDTVTFLNQTIFIGISLLSGVVFFYVIYYALTNAADQIFGVSLIANYWDINL